MGKGAKHAHMPEIKARGYASLAEHFEKQALDLDVGLDARMAIDLGADLQGLPGGGQPGRQGMQYRAAITQSRHTLAIEKVRVDARHLGRDVGAQAHGATGQLVNQLEGRQLHVVAGSGKQRIDVFKQRRQGQFVAMRPKAVLQDAAQLFNASRFRREHVGNVFRQGPL